MESTEVSIQVPLPQMLDLALGTPEVGSVNFNILHNFLRIILHQLNLNNAKAEYHGDDANRIKTMISSLNAGQNFYLHESNVIDIDGSVIQRDNIPDVTTNVYSISDQIPQNDDVIDKDVDDIPMPRTASESESVNEIGRIQETIKSDIREEINQINERLAEVEQNYASLNENITSIRDFVNTSQLPEQDQSFASEKAVQSMEMDREKLELISSDDDKKIDGQQTSTVDITFSVQASKTSGLSTVSMTQQFETAVPQQISKGTFNQLKDEIQTLRGDIMKVMEEVIELRYQQNQADKVTFAEKIVTKEMAATDETKHVDGISSETSQVPSDLIGPIVDEIVDITSTTTLPGSKILTADQDGDIDVKTTQSGSRILTEDDTEDTGIRTSSTKRVSKASLMKQKDFEVKYLEMYENMDARIKKLEQSMKFEDFEDIDSFMDIVRNVKDMGNEIQKLNSVINQFDNEKTIRAENMNTVTAQIEYLRNMKVDREDFEDALVDKADATIIDRKVSYGRFDSACDELSRALEEAILNSSKQENLWKEAIDIVHQEVEGKIDRTEVTPVHEILDEKLQILQKRIKDLTDKRKIYEAVGTKKILSDVQCISCDKEVIMRMEQNELIHPHPMPYRKSIKPYLTYKLDEIRKQSRQLPAKNMNEFTAAMQEYKRRNNTSTHDHLCNRYCGGSHTVTNPQQRITRVGNFFAEWGPNIMPLNDGVVHGTDGQLYKCSHMPPGVTKAKGTCSHIENACCDTSKVNPNSTAPKSRKSSGK